MNRQFVALSGVSMILIVLNHAIHMVMEYTQALGYSLPPGWALIILETFQAFGNFAVPIFLFISGSFIAYAARGNPPRISYKFLQSSLIHILLPYLIWSLAFYLILFTNRGMTFGLLEYVRHLVVGYPYHFIPLLVFFYIISPVVVRLGHRYAWGFLVLIGIYQLFLMNIKYPGILGFDYPGWADYLKVPILWSTMADWLICFPLGMVISMNGAAVKPVLLRYKWAIFGLTLSLLIIALLSAHGVLAVEITRLLSPLLFLLVIPVIPRNSIPAVRQLEQVGKRSYGLYLTHLLILDTLALVVSKTLPQLFQITLLIYPIVFTAGLLVPLWVMGLFAKSPVRKYFRYVFG